MRAFAQKINSTYRFEKARPSFIVTSPSKMFYYHVSSPLPPSFDISCTLYQRRQMTMIENVLSNHLHHHHFIRALTHDFIILFTIIIQILHDHDK
jgi:hypothetical protein